MQTIELNNEELLEEYKQFRLGGVIEALEGRLWCDGEVICQVIMNDKFLSEAEEKKFSDLEVINIRTLKVVSKKLEILIKENISSIIEWIPQTEEASRNAAQMLQEEDREPYRRTIITFLDGCQWFTDSVYLLKSTLHKTGQEMCSEDDWKMLELQFMASVKELLQAYEKQDDILLADILEYDLPEILNNWLELLREQDKILG